MLLRFLAQSPQGQPQEGPLVINTALTLPLLTCLLIKLSGIRAALSGRSGCETIYP